MNFSFYFIIDHNIALSPWPGQSTMPRWLSPSSTRTRSRPSSRSRATPSTPARTSEWGISSAPSAPPPAPEVRLARRPGTHSLFRTRIGCCEVSRSPILSRIARNARRVGTLSLSRIKIGCGEASKNPYFEYVGEMFPIY